MGRKKVWSDGRNNTDTNGASHGTFSFVDITLGGFKLAEDGTGAGKKSLAEIGQLNGAAQSVKKAGTQFVF